MKENNNLCILVILERIKDEMNRIGFWLDNPPNLASKVISGEIRSYLDAPSFELWLQCIFIPNAINAANNNTLPKHSQVGSMAMKEYNYHSNDKEAQQLIKLLEEFDYLIENKLR